MTASYIGDVTWIVNGGGHNHSSSNHKESDGIGWWNNQTLSGWHAFAAPNASGGVGESWTSGFGSAGVMMGRTMVLPAGNYTLSFNAFGCNAGNSADTGTMPLAGDVVAFLTGEENVDITNTAAAGDATFHNVSFTFDVTTDNTAFEFGIKKLADGSKIDWCQIKNVTLTLNSTGIIPVANNSVDAFTYTAANPNTWHTNTWSTEGQRDGSRFQVPFHELWRDSKDKTGLNDATIEGSYTPTQSGVYKVSAWVRAVNEYGSGVSGVSIYVGDVEADACSGSVVMDGKGRLGTYTAMADGVAGTPIGYGFRIKDATANWLAFKNVVITYLGDLPQEEIDALLALVPTGKMNASVQAELNTKVNDLNTDKSVAAYNALASYIPTANASVSVYEEIATIRSTYADKAASLDATGQAAYTSATEAATTGAETMYSDGTYITASEAETAYSRDYTTAVKAQTTPGTDLSELITNSDLYGKEFYNSTDRNTYQDISGLTTGYYLIKAQAYYRAGGGGTESTAQNVEIYGNSESVPVMSINAYTKEKDYPSTGTWSYIESSKSWVPNNPDAGSYAFNTLDAYHNSVAVYVNNGNLRLGIRKNSTAVGADWAYFDNFELIYIGTSLPASLTGASGAMNATVASAQTVAVEAYNADNTVAKYNTAANAIIAAEASISLYGKINADIATYNDKVAILDTYGQAAYSNSSIVGKYEAGSYTSFSEADAELASALATAIKAQVTAGDFTGVIINPSFECNFTGWTNNGMAVQSNNSFEKAGNLYVEKWEPNGTFGVSQTITGMPEGRYILSAKVRARGVTSAKIYVGTELTAMTVDDNTRTYTLDFVYDGEATFTIGFEGIGDGTEASWLCVDNFELSYLGNSTANNLNFADGAVTAGITIRTYAKDKTGSDVSGMQPVLGWTVTSNGDGRAAGVINANSNTKLGNSTVPEAGCDALSNNKMLGILAVWQNTTQYKQLIKVPAGSYKLRIPVYNDYGTGTITNNYFGFEEYGGTTHYSSTTSFTADTWTVEEVDLEFAEDTWGYLSLGYSSGNYGDGTSPHLYVDRVELCNASANMAVNATAQWGTFCAPFAVAIPSGVTAYTCASAPNGVLELTPQDSPIPANTPVILNAESGLSSTMFYGKKEGNEDIVNYGMLYGNVSTEAKNVPSDGSAYLLQRNNNKTGFYQVTETGYKIGYNRCYLVESGEITAREAFFFEDEDETSINEIEAAEAKAKGLKDGKYLINGRIVVVNNGRAFGANGQILK